MTPRVYGWTAGGHVVCDLREVAEWLRARGVPRVPRSRSWTKYDRPMAYYVGLVTAHVDATGDVTEYTCYPFEDYEALRMAAFRPEDVGIGMADTLDHLADWADAMRAQGYHVTTEGL